jgi:hypothetical protein
VEITGKENHPLGRGRFIADDTVGGAHRHCHDFQKRAGTSSLSFRGLGDALAVPKSDATLRQRGARQRVDDLNKPPLGPGLPASRLDLESARPCYHLGTAPRLSL